MLHAPAFSCDIRRAAPRPAEIVLTGPAAFVAQFLDVADDRLDYAAAKVAFDTFIDLECDDTWVTDELDRLTAAAWQLTRGDMRPAVRLGAVRTVLYEAGPWNDHRPFAYDQSDPEGRHLPNKLLHNYLRTRLGQCVSMPALFVILAERLELNVGLASAPQHVFVRYTDDAGNTYNIETTSGGHPARDAWFKETFRITDQSIESGIYLRSLTKREGIAMLAMSVFEALNAADRHQEAMDVAALVLRHGSLNIGALIALGSTAAALLDRIRRTYPDPRTLPPGLREDAWMLMEQNRRCFARADALGWIPFDGEE